MKLILGICLLTFLTCSHESKKEAEVQNKNPLSHDEVISATVNRFSLNLIYGKGKCLLSYRNERDKSSDEKQITLEIDAPCEIVRNPASMKPLSYSYKAKSRIYQVIVIIGGPPNPSRSDHLMPFGCGTEFQTISIYDDEIVVGKKVGHELEIDLGCPTGGLDEMYFAGLR